VSERNFIGFLLFREKDLMPQASLTGKKKRGKKEKRGWLETHVDTMTADGEKKKGVDCHVTAKGKITEPDWTAGGKGRQRSTRTFGESQRKYPSRLPRNTKKKRGKRDIGHLEFPFL